MNEIRKIAAPEAAFLERLDQWRVVFAENLARCYPRLDEHRLNCAVRSATSRLACHLLCRLRDRPPMGEGSTLGPEVLGLAHEHSLTTMLRRKQNGGLVIEDAWHDKRLRGVFYTPAYVVDFIVRNTLGKQLRGKSPQEISPRVNGGTTRYVLTVLDPACGGGWFLIRAYQYLLDWYLGWYLKHSPSARSGCVLRTSTGKWRLAFRERRRILLEHIFGVDLDALAVEVTKLSLLIKLFEEERFTDHDVSFSQTSTLLAKNIKCGNALIGSDLSDELPTIQLDAGELVGQRPFPWKVEFAQAADCGGFDVVIGNPPYGAQQSKNERTHFARQFAAKTTDTAALFMLRARQLTRLGGHNGLIVPKSFTYASNWRHVRQLLLHELTALVDVAQVWETVKLEQAIYFLRRGGQTANYCCFQRTANRFRRLGRISKSDCIHFGFYLNGINDAELAVARKLIGAGEFLGDICANVRGATLQRQITQRGRGRRVIGGKQVYRYFIHGEKGWLDHRVDVPDRARVRPASILVQNVVAHIRKPVEHVKIIGAIVHDAEVHNVVILDTVNQLTNQSRMSSTFLLGLLTSRLINWYAFRFIFARAIRTMHFDGPVTDRIPIRSVDFSQASQVKQHDRIASIVAQMSALSSQRHDCREAVRRAVIDRQINKCEKNLNGLVYELFGLAPQEARMVDGAAG